MGLRPTQGDEKHLLSTNRSPWKHRPPLCHPERSRGICGSADHSWECFSTERSEVEGPAVASSSINTNGSAPTLLSSLGFARDDKGESGGSPQRRDVMYASL